ncbi:unnamed protein product [Brassica oleracea var. botrytis]
MGEGKPAGQAQAVKIQNRQNVSKDKTKVSNGKEKQMGEGKPAGQAQAVKIQNRVHQIVVAATLISVDGSIHYNPGRIAPSDLMFLRSSFFPPDDLCISHHAIVIV